MTELNDSSKVVEEELRKTDSCYEHCKEHVIRSVQTGIRLFRYNAYDAKKVAFMNENEVV